MVSERRAGIVDRRHRHHHLGWNFLVQLDVVLEGGRDRAKQRFDLGAMLRDVVDLLDLDEKVLGVVDVLLNASALLALDEDLDGAVWQPQQLDDGPERADAVDVFLARIVGLRVLLGGKQNVLLLVHRIFQRLDGLLATDEQRHHHVGEDDDVAKRQQRHSQAGADRTLLLVTLVVTEKHRHSFPRPSTERSGGLLSLLVHDQRLFALAYDVFGDHHLLDRRLRWNLEHHVEHDVLENRS